MPRALNQVIHAPSDETPHHSKSIFLAGSTTTTSDWRQTLTTSLSDLSLTIYNPYRADWDQSWREDITFTPYREQVEWELERQDRADIVVVYFHPGTQAPISLLELGIWARVPGKTLVVCPEGYWKRGNVQIVCGRFGVEIVDVDVDDGDGDGDAIGVGGLKDAIVRRLFG